MNSARGQGKSRLRRRRARGRTQPNTTIGQAESTELQQTAQTTPKLGGGARAEADKPEAVALLLVVSWIVGAVANALAVADSFPVAITAAIACLILGTAVLIRQYVRHLLGQTWIPFLKGFHGHWRGRIVPITAVVAAFALPTFSYGVDAQRPNPEADGPTGGGGAAPAGCDKTEADMSKVIYSHRRAAEAAHQDIDTQVDNAGGVRQRFFAASDYISSVAVIISRPPKNGDPPFVESKIGHVKLKLYNADSHGKNGEPLPLKPINTDGKTSAEGMVQMAGINHKDTVFRFCPVKLKIGQRYAFEVTNVEPNVVLAFSLSTEKNPEASMDIFGERHGENRTQINYSQVAGYVCSTINC